MTRRRRVTSSEAPAKGGPRSTCPAGATGAQGELLVLTPARNEAENLAELHRRLSQALDGAGIAWRWLLVDDASDDGTFAGLAAIAERDARVAGIRHAEPAGSHAAILAGIRIAAARPEFAGVAILAADLQDPPEALPRLVAAWRNGAEIVFAARSGWADAPFHRRLAGRAVHTAVRLVLPGSRYPWSGSDMGVFGRHAIDALAEDPRPVGNVFVRAARLGLKTAVVPVAKCPRRHGRGKWSARALSRFGAETLAEAFGRPVRIGTARPPVAAWCGWAGPECGKIGTGPRQMVAAARRFS